MYFLWEQFKLKSTLEREPDHRKLIFWFRFLKCLRWVKFLHSDIHSSCGLFLWDNFIRIPHGLSDMWWKVSHHSFFFRFLSHPHPRNLFLLYSRKWRVASAGNFNLVLFRRLFKKLFRNVWAYPKKEMRLILLSTQRNFRNLMVKIWFRIQDDVKVLSRWGMKSFSPRGKESLSSRSVHVDLSHSIVLSPEDMAVIWRSALLL